jgi:hypothetical protein
MNDVAGKGRWKPPGWRRLIGRSAQKGADRLTKNQSPEWRLRTLENGLARVIKKFGPDSGPAARGREAIAQQLEIMGRFAEARYLWQEALVAHRRHVGDDDERTLLTEELLAANIRRSGLREEARAHFLHVYEVRLRTLGPEDELTQRTERWLASIDDEGNSDT